MQYQEAGGAELCRVEGGSGMSMISAGQAEGLHQKHIQHLVLPFVDRATLLTHPQVPPAAPLGVGAGDEILGQRFQIIVS